jgi:outer membrane protein TolC
VARNRYEGGLARYLDVLSAEDQLLASVRQLVDVQSRALTLDIGLHRALGGGWRSPRRHRPPNPLRPGHPPHSPA